VPPIAIGSGPLFVCINTLPEIFTPMLCPLNYMLFS
jgi:hypothetical protein